MNHKNNLIDKFKARRATIGVVGLGYAGLPLAVAFAQAGFQVVGMDVAAEKVAMLKKGQSYIPDVPTAEIAAMVANDRFHPTTDYEQLATADAISICVPTPLTKSRDPDLSYMTKAIDTIARLGVEGKLIVVQSTTYPGSTEEEVLPQLTRAGANIGQDFFLAYAPERIDPGRIDFTMHNTPKVIGGVTAACQETAVALFGTIVAQPVPVTSAKAAEMVKLLENIYRAVNIGFVNEMALICDRLGLDIWEIVAAAATKPYGFTPFYPGPGLGGHCIPVDPHYLSWKLRMLNYTTRFVQLASEVNNEMPAHVVGKVVAGLNEVRKAVNGSRILLVGVAFKPNVDDIRQSPALEIIRLLHEQGAEINYHDPFVPTLSVEQFTAESVPLTAVALQQADCVVIVTNHDALSWSLIAQHALLIVDTRNSLHNQKVNGRLITL